MESISVVHALWTDDIDPAEEVSLDWLHPFGYTMGQWIVVGGALLIVICVLSVCSVYCWYFTAWCRKLSVCSVTIHIDN